MAGGKLKQTRSLRASSILEVVIAMVIIVVIFSIALTIYANVLRWSLSVKELAARALLTEISRRPVQTGYTQERTFPEGDLTISEKISPYRQESKLAVLELEAFDQNNQSIALLRKIIILPDE